MALEVWFLYNEVEKHLSGDVFSSWYPACQAWCLRSSPPRNTQKKDHSAKAGLFSAGKIRPLWYWGTSPFTRCRSKEAGAKPFGVLRLTRKMSLWVPNGLGLRSRRTDVVLLARVFEVSLQILPTSFNNTVSTFDESWRLRMKVLKNWPNNTDLLKHLSGKVSSLVTVKFEGSFLAQDDILKLTNHY